MEAILREMYNWISLYYGDRVYFYMAVVAYVYLFFACKKERSRLLWPVVLIIFLIANPILYKVVYSKIIYWRLLWLLPNSIVIAYSAVRIIKNRQNKVTKVVLLLMAIVTIIVFGTNMYKVGGFDKTRNLQKVSADTELVCEYMLSKSQSPSCIAPLELVVEARQYNGDIKMLYGRNVIGYINWPDDVARKVFNELISEIPDAEYIFGTAYNKKIDFVILPKGKSISDDVAASYGYYMVEVLNEYPVYYNKDVQERSLEGWIVTQYGSNTAGGYFYTVEDEDNNLIIIDGGYDWYLPRLEAVVRAHNNHVEAWIMTSTRNAHSGAFQELVKNYPDIRIDKIYAQDISAEMIQQQKAGAKEWEKEDYLTPLMELLRDMDNVVYVKEGDCFTELGLEFEILHTWDEEVNVIGEYHSWNGAICFTMKGKDEKMLYLSSLTAPMEQYILARHIDDIDCDYVQVNNQGEWFFSAAFYDSVSAHTAFIECGQSAIDPEGDKPARHVYGYMGSRGTKTYILEDAPNWVIMK